MRLNAVLLAVIICAGLYAGGCVAYADPQEDARAAVAVALSSAPCCDAPKARAPSPRPDGGFCSSACTCGCRVGEKCTCGTSTAPDNPFQLPPGTRIPPTTPPVRQPMMLAPAANCGPRG